MTPDPASRDTETTTVHHASPAGSLAGDQRPGDDRHRFNIGDALHEGMTAFSQAPLSFALFAAGLTGLQVLLLPLQERVLVKPGSHLEPSDGVLFLLGILLSLGVSLWGSQGMVRGAWAALEGKRPSLVSLLRWDGTGFGRLVRAWGLLGLLLLIPLLVLLVALLVAMLLLATPERGGHHQQEPMLLATVLVGALAMAALGAFGLLLTYLGVNQQFLAQIALLEGRNGIATLKRGRRLVDHQWLLLLLLLLIKGLLLLLGGLLGFITLGIGWILAWPLVSCITTAAYRQLLQREAVGADARLNPAGHLTPWR